MDLNAALQQSLNEPDIRAGRDERFLSQCMTVRQRMEELVFKSQRPLDDQRNTVRVEPG